jgi:hypothetical protein
MQRLRPDTAIIGWSLCQEQRVFCETGTAFTCSPDYNSKVMDVKTHNRAEPA